MDCQKHLFSLPDDHHYLNGAYFSPLLKTVEAAGITGIQQKREPWHTKPHHFFEQSNQLRSLFAKLINAPDANTIAIIPSASYGLSTVAKNLPDKTSKKIIIVGEQFPSNVYPWKRYCRTSGCKLQVITAPGEFVDRGKVWNQRILEAIDSETLMVAIGNVHWSDGTLFDLTKISERARDAEALLVIDGTQSVGALPLDVQSVQPDALICAGYKWLMGPYSIGMAYFGEHFRNGTPLEEGWIERKDSEDFSGLVRYAREYQPGAIRHDVGERSNFILVPMMAEALKQINAWQPDQVQSYCRNLTKELAEKLPEYGYKMEEPGRRAHHLFGIHLPKHIQPKELQEKLAANNIHVSVRGSALRISPNVYNDEQDIDALQKVLGRATR